MIRTAAFLAVVLWGSMGWGQVVYAPPEPCYREDGVDPWAKKLISALHWPETNVVVNVNGNGRGQAAAVIQGPVIIVPSGECLSPAALGVDPLTGQSLHFRKRDLLPAPPRPEPMEEEPTFQRPEAPPSTQPSANRGQILIKPWRGGGGKLVNR